MMGISRISLANEDEDEDESAEITDRSYWEKRSTPQMMKIIDRIFQDVSDITTNYELKYNKFYVGIAKDGVANNFISFRPKKQFIYFCIKLGEDEEITKQLEDKGFDASFVGRNKQYEIRFDSYSKYEKHQEFIRSLVQMAKDQKIVD